MEECFKCGVESTQEQLYDGVSKEGIVKVCKSCAEYADMPLVKKPNLNQLKESEKPNSIHEKLSKISGVDAKKHSKRFSNYYKEKMREKQDMQLRDLVEENFKKRQEMKKEIKSNLPEPELVENFHWRIMRARRYKKLMQSQLAREIGESETAIKMIEQGSLPQDYSKLIRKLEAFLGIRLFKNPPKEKKEISFDPVSKKELTIEDLKPKNKEENVFSEERELSDEEIEDIMFGR